MNQVKIGKFISECRKEKQITLIEGDATEVLKTLEEPFDMIFMDPPYLKGWEEKIAALISEYGLLKPNGILIVESASETTVRVAGLDVVKEKIYKTTRFTFMQPVETD